MTLAFRNQDSEKERPPSRLFAASKPFDNFISTKHFYDRGRLQ